MFQVFRTYLDTNFVRNHTEKYDLFFEYLDIDSYSHSYGTFSLSGFSVDLARCHTPYLMNTYLPTILLTLTSFLGFFIPVHMVPGRMTLLVTVFLVLVNIRSTERHMGPVVSIIIKSNLKTK